MAPMLETEIGSSEQEYGYIIAAIQFAYAAGTLLMGFVIDKLGRPTILYKLSYEIYN